MRTLPLLTALAFAPRLAAPQGAKPVPWTKGEYLEYSVKFSGIPAGSGRMQVLGLDSIRGRNAWRLRFDFSGGTLFLRVNDAFDSWLDTDALHSLRFEQRLNELGRKTDRDYEIFPERSKFRLNGGEERESVPEPLDEASLFYIVRMLPLEVGQSYDLNRYFDNKANPVTLRVLRKDSVEVPAGKFAALVIQPLIKTSGIFSEGGQAELWFSDDNRRILLQMHIKLKFGAINLYLRKMDLPSLPSSTGGRQDAP